MNGGDLCGHLRKMPRSECMPVLILTAHDSDGIRSAARQAGATDFMTKPFSLRELADAVDQLLTPVPAAISFA